jgi:HEPN domain-containing protein
MLTKQDYIKYWLDTAEKDFVVVESLFEGKNYVHSLFFAHLVLEKIIKAHWVKDNEEDIPPKMHNLVYLIKQTKFEYTQEQEDFLRTFNDFQLEARYPDYQMKIYNILTEAKTQELLDEFKEIRLCLLNKIALEQQPNSPEE